MIFSWTFRKYVRLIQSEESQLNKRRLIGKLAKKAGPKAFDPLFADLENTLQGSDRSADRLGTALLTSNFLTEWGGGRTSWERSLIAFGRADFPLAAKEGDVAVNLLLNEYALLSSSLLSKERLERLGDAIDTLDGPGVVDKLAAFIAHPNPGLRLKVVKLLERHGCTKLLIQMLESRHSGGIAAEALARLNCREAIPVLLEQLQHGHDPSSMAAAIAVMGDADAKSEAIRVVTAYLEGNDFSKAARALATLAHIGDAPELRLAVDYLVALPVDRGRKEHVEALLSLLKRCVHSASNSDLLLLRQFFPDWYEDVCDTEGAETDEDTRVEHKQIDCSRIRALAEAELNRRRGEAGNLPPKTRASGQR